MDYNFDETNCDLIGSFMSLKEKCSFFEKNILGEGFFNTNLNEFSFIYYRSFYSDFRDVCDLSLFFLINEEISNAHGRDHLPKLLVQVFKNKNFITPFQDEYKHSRAEQQYNDITKLVKYQYNEIVDSMMLDFTVSSFSVFDRWINVFYEKTCSEHKDKLIKNRSEKISKQLKKYKISSEEHILEKISDKILAIPGKFISLSEKFNGIYELTDKKSYARDIHCDRNIINFLSSKRNTVHNLGEHRGQNMTITVDGIEHELRTGRPANSASWVNLLGLIGHLVKIYSALLLSIPNSSDLLEGFIESKLDNSAIVILTDKINDFLQQYRLKAKRTKIKQDFSDFLVGKFGFSNKQSEAFIKNTIKHRGENLSGSEIITLLSMPNRK